MKITIELDLLDQNARVLRSWVSVGRFHDSVLRLCDKIVEGSTVEHQTEQDSIAVEEDCRTLKPALSELHYQLRAKLVELGIKPLWDQNQR
jgi:hypothetical protein